MLEEYFNFKFLSLSSEGTFVEMIVLYFHISVIAVLVLLAVLTVCSLVLGVKRNEGEQHWAVLVAGSNSWYNYRHQVRMAVRSIY